MEKDLEKQITTKTLKIVSCKTFLHEYITEMRSITNYVYPFFVGLMPFLTFLFINSWVFKNDPLMFFRFLEIVIWPLTIILGAFFFRKVLTYLFFSMEEFNFFGAKGDLKNVKEVINEKAKEIFQRELERQKHKDEIELIKNDK